MAARKVIQIAVAAGTGIGDRYGGANDALYALCDDGSIWVSNQPGSWEAYEAPPENSRASKPGRSAA